MTNTVAFDNSDQKKKKKIKIPASAKQSEDRHREEMKVVKLEANAESSRFQQLLASFEEGNAGLKQLRAEMEEKHAREMEELRTYFEQKCLQMEKQYSEEVFSQQSRKMSDNDSEAEELTDDVYLGGGGGLADNKDASSESIFFLNNEVGFVGFFYWIDDLEGWEES